MKAQTQSNSKCSPILAMNILTNGLSTESGLAFLKKKKSQPGKEILSADSSY